jgi:hypothetical protein
MKPKTTQILALIAISAATLAGLVSIVQRSAQQPDNYPEFSSYRTLPEGTSVLYEALRRSPGMTADRNVQPLNAIRVNNAAILILGIQPTSLYGDGQWFADMEELAGNGNRVIIGLLPHRTRFIQPEKNQLEDALQHWNVRLAFARQTDIRDEEEGKLTPGWPMYFSQAKGWDTLRAENGKPVVIQRGQGKGTLVLLTNPFLLTNAAMVEDRQTVFLSNLIGPVHQAIFDETHFGIEETGSIAALARRYRLQGLVLGLVLVASLFIWKSAAAFPPSLGDRLEPVKVTQGADSSSAFLNLIRRSIRPDDILATCVEEWRKMYQRKAGSNLRTAIDLAESGRKTPAQTYAQIQQILGAKQNPS